jgi:4-amino-4-deoxy-L-arabinose transferase-like glycosyltransferase
VLIAAAALAIYVVYHRAHAGGILDPAAMEYAQLARNLARGEGFTTNVVRPLSLARVTNISHHPDLYHAPLHPLWTAAFMKLGGATPQMVSWACGVAYLLSLPLVYYLGLRLFDRRIGLLAVALYGVNYLSLQYAVSGLETSLAALFVAGLMLALYVHLSAGERPAPVTAALCGAAACLCFLTEYVYLVLLLPVLMAVVLRGGRRRWAELGVSLGAFALVAAPWGVHNWRAAGDPFCTLELSELVSNTSTYQGHSVFRQFGSPPSALAFAVTHPKEMWLKVRPLTLSMYESVPSLGGPFVAAFFLAGILLRLGSDAVRDLRYVHYAWVVLVCGAICLVSGNARMLVPLSPLVAVIAAATFLSLLDPWIERLQGPRRKRQALVWSLVALVAVCWYPVLAMTASREAEPPDAAAELRQVAKTLTDREIHPVVADQPWTLAWYGDIDAIWLPQTADDLHAMEAATGPMRYLVLSPLVTSAADQEGIAPWAELYAAARRGVKAPYERFIAADLLGERGQWVLCGRVPEGGEAQAAPTP